MPTAQFDSVLAKKLSKFLPCQKMSCRAWQGCRNIESMCVEANS